MKVLDLSRLLPGPFCTLVLADLGAEVVKVEDTGLGDYVRPMPPLYGDLGGRFVALNRGKRSLSIDLKAPEGAKAFLRLAAGYDVVVESFRPGVLDKLGVGHAALAAVNPGIVLVSLSGYGQDGPYRDRAGHDLNYIALAGVLGLNGTRAAPQVPGVQLADIAGGGLWGALAVLAALAGRAQNGGRGRHVDVSMTEGALAFLAPELVNAGASGRQPVRGGEVLTGRNACYGVYETADGGHLAVAALEPKFWLAFCAAIGRAGNAAEVTAPSAEQERIRAEVQAILRQRTRAEWEAVFAKVDACVEPVLRPEELAAHPLHRARRNFFAVEDARAGALPQVRTPLAQPEATRPPPRHGEHSVQILEEAGFSRTEIDALAATGVVKAR